MKTPVPRAVTSSRSRSAGRSSRGGGPGSIGSPSAATGIANVWEVCHHLRGEAGDRQIEGAKVGLAHVIGTQIGAGMGAIGMHQFVLVSGWSSSTSSSR